jgi:hypothetical protein
MDTQCVSNTRLSVSQQYVAGAIHALRRIAESWTEANQQVVVLSGEKQLPVLETYLTGRSVKRLGVSRRRNGSLYVWRMRCRAG